MGRESATLAIGASISAAILSAPAAAAEAILIGLLIIGIPMSIGGGLLMARWRKAVR